MERDGIYWPGVHEQDCDLAGMDYGVAGRAFDPGMDPGILLDELSVAEQTLLGTTGRRNNLAPVVRTINLNDPNISAAMSCSHPPERNEWV